MPEAQKPKIRMSPVQDAAERDRASLKVKIGALLITTTLVLNIAFLSREHSHNDTQKDDASREATVSFFMGGSVVLGTMAGAVLVASGMKRLLRKDSEES